MKGRDNYGDLSTYGRIYIKVDLEIGHEGAEWSNFYRPVVTIGTTRLYVLELCILPTQCISAFHMVLKIYSLSL
jgi:hypothetical protein